MAGANLFSVMGARMNDKLKSVVKDDADKHIESLLERGTNEGLLDPDLQASFELVDLVNGQPTVMSEKVLRTVNRFIVRPSVKVQLLTLSMLDTCVRNCHPHLHTTLATSLLWSDMVKLVQDTSVSRIDDEVSMKILSLIEDYARSLGHVQVFKDTYDSLVAKGVAFPVRPDAVPFTPYKPPAVPPPPVPQSVLPPGMEAPSAAAQVGGGGSQYGEGAFAALKRNGSWAADAVKKPASQLASSVTLEAVGSAAQRAGGGLAVVGGVASTVAKATPVGMMMDAAGNVVPAPAREGITTMLSKKFENLFNRGDNSQPAIERQQQALREREHIQRDRQQLQRDRAMAGGISAEMLASMSEEDRAAIQAVMAADQAAGVGSTTEVSPPPHIPDDPAEALQVMSTAITLFAEMVGSIKDEEPAAVRDPVLTDLAEQCTFFKSKLVSAIDRLTDEQQLLSSLALNDTLTNAVQRYDALLANALMLRARGGSGTNFPVPPPAPNTQTQQPQQPQTLGNLAFGGLSADEGPRFTLLDEGEEEETEGLTTKRAQAGGQQPPPPQ